MAVGSHDPEVWALNIGRFIMAFGQIEWSVNFVLRSWITDKKLRKRILEMQLADRIVLLRSMAPTQNFGAPANLKILFAQLDEIGHLQSQRNLLAHSPMSITIEKYDPANPQGLRAEVVISSERSDKRMKLSELIEVAAKVKGLSDTFSRNCTEIAQHGEDFAGDGRVHVAHLDEWKP